MWDRCSNCDPTTQVDKKHASFVSKTPVQKIISLDDHLISFY
jgi:hypothetical protein